MPARFLEPMRRRALPCRPDMRWPLTLLALLLLSACGSEGGETGANATAGALACASNADCAPLEDGDACNGTLRCDTALALCVFDAASVVQCDPANDSACAQNRCDRATGSCALQPAPTGSACDDGDPCTTGDRCEGTTCAAGPDSCGCHSDADCPDDGDLCNGSTYCDTKSFPYACALKPGSVVTCSGSDGPCLTSTCEPKTGGCVDTAVADGGACDDDNPCTAGETCTKGACKGGTEICACSVDADCPDLDGDACTGVPYCDKSGGNGTCKTNPATVVQCATDADTACVKNQCDKVFGGCKLKPVADKTACDDGDACTKGEICVGGACAGGTDTCKCSSDADCKDADDGNLCNGTPFCNLASGKCETNPATVVVCPTVKDSACAKNVCLPAYGKCSMVARAEAKQVGCQSVDFGGNLLVQFCLYAAKQDGEAGDPGPFACEDSNPCTKGDVCDAKTCKPGPVVCECSNDADCVGKDDGNLCNGTMFCNSTSGKCEVNPATIITCPSVDDTACSKNQCQPKSGACLPSLVAPGTACDDGNACTTGDVCKLGTCTAGTFTCECAKDSDCAVKDDGDLCNGVQFCDLSGKTPACKPQPNSAVFCSKAQDTACLQSTCAAKTGQCALQPLKAGTLCDDDNPCTTDTTCGSGACAGGKTNACDDGNPCTIDSCAKDKGCVHVAKACDDGNGCTLSVCDAKLGTCSNTPMQKGAACNGDNDGCTVGDSCDGKGACEVGAPAICTGKTDACQHNACQSKGADGFACAVVADKDGALCADGDPCFTGASCSGGVCKAGAVETLWSTAPKTSGLAAYEAATFVSGAIPTAIGDGHGALVLAGMVTSGADKGSWRVTALGRDGKVAWERKVTAPAGTTLGAVRDVLDRGGLGVMVVGRAVRSDKTEAAVSVTISSAGVVAAPVTLGSNVAVGMRLEHAVLHPTGNLVCAGVVQDGPKPGAVAMFDPLGAAVWAEPVETQWVNVVRIIDAGDGSVIVVANNTPHPKGLGATGYHLVRMDANGKLQWQLGQGAAGYLTQIAVAAKTAAGPLRLFVRALDESGTLVQAQWFSVDVSTGGVVNLTRPIATSAEVAQVGGEAAGAILWAGAPEQGGVPVTRADRFGNIHWRRLVANGPSDLRGVIASADGTRIAVYGGAAANAGPVAAVVDRWGFASCAARGACAAKTWADCDDGSGCTNDGCDAVASCTHTPQAENLCDPGMPCTHEGKCKTGSCKPHTYGRTFVNGYFDAPSAAAGLSLEGDSAVALWRHINSGSPGVYYFAHTVVHLNDGQIGDNGEIPLPGLQAPVRVVRNAAGNVLVTGSVADAGRKSVLVALVNKTKDAQIGSGVIADATCKSCDLELSSAVKAADGGFYVIGSGSDGGGKSVIGRVGADGSLSWTSAIGGAPQPTILNAAFGRADGGMVYAGQTVKGGAIVPIVGWINADKSGHGNVVDPLSINGNLQAITERGDGSLVAVGLIPVGTTTTGLVVAVGSNHKVLWRRVASLADGMLYDNVIALAGGEFVMAGNIAGGGQTSLLLERSSATGKTLWQRSHRFNDLYDMGSMEESLVQTNDGAFALAVYAHLNGGAPGYAMARTDASGHFSCNGAGGCAAKAVDSCDDSNPCTSDYCDAKLGCQHGNIDGLSCGGGGVCGAGKCVQP